jgi:hypothetical protein
MRDGQLEDRLRAVLRTEGDALPLTITTAELERRMALRRRERVGRRAGALAAAVAVVAVGSLVVATSGWFQSSGVGTGPSAVPTASPVPSRAALPCETIDVSDSEDPPAVVLGTRPGDSIAHQGVVTAFRIGNTTGEPSADWPGLEPFMVETSVQLEALASSPDACIEQLQVTYERARQGTSLPPVFPSLPTHYSIPQGGPTRVIGFDPPATAGDWFIRVKAVFATDPPDVAWTEAVFRIVVPEPAPLDDSVLGPFPYLATPPATILVDEMSATRVPGEIGGRIDATIAGEVPPRALYIVYVACLGPSPIRWSIGREDGHDFLVADDQTCDGTLNEVGIERGTPTSPLAVVVNADPATVWRIRIATTDQPPGFIPPAIRMIETGNTAGATGAAEAFARCVVVADASAPCGGEWFDLDGARPATTTTLSRVTLGLEDGWEIDEARITAVARDQLAENVFAPEHSIAFVEDGGPLITVEVPLEPGAWVVRVALNASRNGETFSAHYDLLLIVDG